MPSQVLRTQGITEEAWIRFLRAHAAVTRELSARLENAHGLTRSDFEVLVQLAHSEGNRLRRVARARAVILPAPGNTSPR